MITSDGAGEDAWYGAGVAVIDLVTGDERSLATSQVQLGWVAGSPSGDRAAVIEAVCSDRVVVCGDLRVIDVASGSTCQSRSGKSTPPGRAGSTTTGSWCSGDAACDLSCSRSRSRRRHRERWSTDGSRRRALPPRGAAFGDGFAVSCRRTGPPRPRRVDADGPDGRSPPRGTPWPRRRARCDRPARVAPLGRERRPRDRGDPHPAAGRRTVPLLLDVHGGPIGNVDDRFPGTLDALLLSRGFAILRRTLGARPVGVGLRERGSWATWAGSTSTSACRCRRGGEAGVADPDRLVLTGGATAVSCRRGSRPATAGSRPSVAISPVTDWWSERFDSSLGAWVGDFLAGSRTRCPASTPAQPGAARGDVTTPDPAHRRPPRPRDTVGQAVECYRALRERGVPSRGRDLPREGHGVGDLPADLDLATRTVAWFERFLPARRRVGCRRRRPAKDAMTTRDELEALPTKELHDRAIATAKHRLDVGFLWDLLKALPWPRRSIGDDQRSKMDIIRPLALMNDLSTTPTRAARRGAATHVRRLPARARAPPRRGRDDAERDLARYRERVPGPRPQGLPDQRVARAGPGDRASASTATSTRGRRRARPTTSGSRTSSRPWAA